MLTFLVITAGTSFAIAYFHRADNTFKTRMILMLAGYGVLTALMLISFFWIYVARKDIETTYTNISEDQGVSASTREYRKAIISANEKNIKTTSYNFEQWVKRVYNPKIREFQSEITRKKNEIKANPSQAQVIYQDIFARETDMQGWEKDAERYQNAIENAKDVLKELKANSEASNSEIDTANTQIKQLLEVFDNEQSQDVIFKREFEAQRVERLKRESRNQSGSSGGAYVAPKVKSSREWRDISMSSIESTLRKLESLDPVLIKKVLTNISDLSKVITIEVDILRDRVKSFLDKCSCVNFAEFMDKITADARKNESDFNKKAIELNSKINNTKSNQNPASILDLYTDIQQQLDVYYTQMKNMENDYREMIYTTDDIMNKYNFLKLDLDSLNAESNRLILTDDNKSTVNKELLLIKDKVKNIEIEVSRANIDERRIKKTSEILGLAAGKMEDKMLELKEEYEKKFLKPQTIKFLKEISKSLKIISEEEKITSDLFEKYELNLIGLDNDTSDLENSFRNDGIEKILDKSKDDLKNLVDIFLKLMVPFKEDVDRIYNKALENINNSEYDDKLANETAQEAAKVVNELKGKINDFSKLLADDILIQKKKKKVPKLGFEKLNDRAISLTEKFDKFLDIVNKMPDNNVGREQKLTTSINNAKNSEKGRLAGENITNYIESIIQNNIKKLKKETAIYKNIINNRKNDINNIMARLDKYLNLDQTLGNIFLDGIKPAVQQGLADVNAEYEKVKESVDALENIVKMNEGQIDIFA